MPESYRFNIIDNWIGVIGIDACGKTTLAKEVTGLLDDHGYKVYHIKTPSNSVWGRTQKGILQKENGSKKKAAVFGILDFFSIIPYIEGARLADKKIKSVSEYELSNGDIDIISKKIEEANKYSRHLCIMERFLLADAVAYLPSLKDTLFYKICSYLIPKPGLLIRLKTPPEQAYRRALERKEKLEITENLESLIEADKNFDNLNLHGVEVITIDSSDNVLPEESAREIIHYVKKHKRKVESRVRRGMNKMILKVNDILGDGLEYFRREDKE